MKNHPGWPHTLDDAIAAEIVPWASRGIGVRYTFPGNDQQSNPIGTEDVPRSHVSNVLAKSPISTTTLAADTRP